MSFRGVVTTHYNDVIMSLIASQITSHTIVYSTVYSDANQRKHQSSASLVFVRGIHRGHMNSPHKGPVTRKMFPFDDVIMWWYVRGNRSAVQFSLEINWRVYNTQDKMSHILNGRKKTFLMKSYFRNFRHGNTTSDCIQHTISLVWERANVSECLMAIWCTTWERTYGITIESKGQR